MLVSVLGHATSSLAIAHHHFLDLATVPLWTLSRSIQGLGLHFQDEPLGSGTRDEIDEQSKASLTSYEAFELPEKLPTDKAGIRALNLSVACGTTITAAKSGVLESLAVSKYIQQPFAARSMLPYWVRINNFEVAITVSS